MPRYEALINDVQEFYNSENSKLNELNLRYDETERVQVEQQVCYFIVPTNHEP